MLVLAGDIGTSTQGDVAEALGFFRRLAGSRPILWVRGNHDFWDIPATKGLDKVMEEHRRLAATHAVHLLDEAPYEYGGVLFAGWMGWYGERDPATNDHLYMPPFTQGLPTGEWLANWEKASLGRVLDQIDLAKARRDPPRAVVAVTHFPCVPHLTVERYSASPRHFQFLPGRVDALLMGHSHRRVEGMEIDGVRLFNSGSDYDRPSYISIVV